jgi:hypothetical protein
MHSNTNLSNLADGTARGYYSRFMRLTILGGLILFALAPIGAVFFALFESKNINQTLFVFAASFGFFGVALYGRRLIPFLSSVVEARTDGLHISHKNKEIFYPWSALSHATGNLAMQVMDIYSADGKRILSVDYMLTGFRGFQRCIAMHIPCRA